MMGSGVIRNPFAWIMGAAVGLSGSLMIYSLGGLAILKSGGLGLLLGALSALLFQGRHQLKEDQWDEGQESRAEKAKAEG